MPPLYGGCMKVLERKIRLTVNDIREIKIKATNFYHNIESDEERLEQVQSGVKSSSQVIQESLTAQRGLFSLCDELASYIEYHQTLINKKVIKDEKEEYAQSLIPDVEFERIAENGKKILASLGIDLAREITPLDRAKEEKERINRVVTTAKFKKELLKYFYEPELSNIIESFKTMTIREISQSGKISQKAYSMITQAPRGKNEDLAMLGQPLVDMVNKLIASSSVSQPDAMAFAKAINIDSRAIKALKKSDYSGKKGRDKLEVDIADLYRLTGGAISIDYLTKTPRESRANYLNTFNRINIGSGLDKPTLWHELTHSIEHEHPKVLQAVKGFLAGRLKMAQANGSGIKQLKAIYPQGNYRRDEVAIEDSAFSHYVTKLYRKDDKQPISTDNISSSEVLTMGIESLSDPYLAGKLLEKDPDHAAFTLGVLAELREK